MDAPAILVTLHGRFFRIACAHVGRHFDGLGAAGRHLHREGIIDNRLKNRFLRLDIVAAYCRHASEPLADSILAEFAAALVAKKGTRAQQSAGQPEQTDEEKLHTEQPVQQQTEAGVQAEQPTALGCVSAEAAAEEQATAGAMSKTEPEAGARGGVWLPQRGRREQCDGQACLGPWIGSFGR